MNIKVGDRVTRASSSRVGVVEAIGTVCGDVHCYVFENWLHFSLLEKVWEAKTS